MSRKSRQRKGRTLLQKVFPAWLAVPILIIALGMGILCGTIPWSGQPTPYEDTIPVSATVMEVEGDYRCCHNHRSLHQITHVLIQSMGDFFCTYRLINRQNIGL